MGVGSSLPSNIANFAKEAQVVLQSKHKKLLKAVDAGDLDSALQTLAKFPSLIYQQVNFDGDSVSMPTGSSPLFCQKKQF